MNAFPYVRFVLKFASVLVFIFSQNAFAVVPPDVCANIAQLGIDKQVNARAAEILATCGLSPAPATVVSAPATLPNAATIGGTDQNLIDAMGNIDPHVTQSETQVWAEQNTIVVTYNDSRSAPGCYAGGSYSSDYGDSWNTINAFCSGHGINYGDPFVVYDQKNSVWVAGFLATGCGGQGIGIWTSSDGITWTVAPCAHNGLSDDRESAWVDNSPSSAYYGRIYVTWNDFTQPSYNIYVAYSDNGGMTWSAPNVVSPSDTFYRNVQVTTGPDGTVFVASMDEGGGGLSMRTNLLFRSSNGGTTWDQITIGSFPAAGSSICSLNSYFATMFPANIWRHMGWGDIAAGPNGVIHYAYSQHGSPASDVADIYYTRSTDNGTTWEPGIKLNTDTDIGKQWQASVSVSPEGHVLVSWYDTRTQLATNYERWGRFSADNGLTWEADASISDASSPLPLQLDPNVHPCYTGDYDRSFFSGGSFLGAWVDGRGPLVNSSAQQDVFFDQVADNVTPPPPPPPPPTDIVLSAIGSKVKGVETVDLMWSPANSGNTIDVFRNSGIIISVDDSGAYTDNTGVKGNKGVFDYQVCIQENSQCSNTVTISFSKK